MIINTGMRTDIPAFYSQWFMNRIRAGFVLVRNPYRPAVKADEDFLQAEDEYLTALTESKGITDISDLTPVEDGIYLWKGDITTLKCGAIVNAANSGMTECWQPCHSCIDNCIHTFAGVRLRYEC